MNNLFEQKQVEEFAEKVLGKLKDTIKTDIADKLYSDMSSYLYEHYNNADDRIKQDLIEKISEEFVKNPSDYKFKKIREKLYKENKEELVSLLNDEQIFESVEKIVWDYTHKEHGFKWKWEESIAKFIIKHIDDFKDNKRIQDMFGKENKKLNDYINSLKQQIEEIKNITDSSF